MHERRLCHCQEGGALRLPSVSVSASAHLHLFANPTEASSARMQFLAASAEVEYEPIVSSVFDPFVALKNAFVTKEQVPESLRTSPYSGHLCKLKRKKSPYSRDYFVDRFFWIDRTIHFFRYAPSKKDASKAAKTKIKGIAFADMIAVNAMPHEKFFVISGKPKKLTLRASSAEVAAEWVEVLKKELSAYRAENPRSSRSRKPLKTFAAVVPTEEVGCVGSETLSKETSLASTLCLNMEVVEMIRHEELKRRNDLAHFRESVVEMAVGTPNTTNASPLIKITCTGVKYQKRHAKETILACTPRSQNRSAQPSTRHEAVTTGRKMPPANIEQNASSTIKLKRASALDSNGVKNFEKKARPLYAGRQKKAQPIKTIRRVRAQQETVQITEQMLMKDGRPGEEQKSVGTTTSTNNTTEERNVVQ